MADIYHFKFILTMKYASRNKPRKNPLDELESFKPTDTEHWKQN